MKMKARLRYNFLPNTLARIKKYDNVFCWQVCGKACSHVLLMDCKWIRPFLQGIWQYLIILFTYLLFIQQSHFLESTLKIDLHQHENAHA